MRLARVVHFDESDTQVFHNPARTGEWAISGGFEFSNWGEADLTGKQRQAFANGWLGVETFGRATLVAVAEIEPAEIEALEARLAQHFVDLYGAPTPQAAMPVAHDEIAQMVELCTGQEENTVLTVLRELSSAGVREQYRLVQPDAAALDQFAIHGTLDDLPEDL